MKPGDIAKARDLITKALKLLGGPTEERLWVHSATGQRKYSALRPRNTEGVGRWLLETSIWYDSRGRAWHIEKPPTSGKWYRSKAAAVRAARERAAKKRKLGWGRPRRDGGRGPGPQRDRGRYR